MEKLVVRISQVMGTLAALAIVVLMVAIVIDVVVRYTTGSSVPAMVELAESSLIMAVFFGLAWGGVTGGHVAVTIVADRFSRTVSRMLAILVWGGSSAFLGWFTYATTLRAISATQRKEIRMGLVQWPMWPMRWVIVLGLAMLCLVCVANTVRSLRAQQLLPADSAGEEAVAEADVDVPIEQRISV